MKPSGQVEIIMLFETQINHLKVNFKIILTTLKKNLLNLIKMKNLWNQIQIQLEVHNQIHSKSDTLLTLRFLLNKHTIHL